MAKKKTSDREQVRVVARRAPKFLPFLLSTGVLGALVGVILYLGVPEANRSSADILGFLIVFGALVGMFFGGVIILALDWYSRKNATEVQATKLKQ